MDLWHPREERKLALQLPAVSLSQNGPSSAAHAPHVSLLTDIVFQEATGCLHLSSELRGMIEFSCCGC